MGLTEELRVDIGRVVWSVCAVALVGVGVAAVRPGLAAGGVDETRSVSHALTAAEQAIREKRYGDAEDYLRVALQSEPDNAKAAETLRRLHAMGGGKLGIDHELVDQSVRALGHGFRREQTKHFTIVTDCEVAWSRERGRLLERAYTQFRRVMRRMDLESAPPRKKLVCVLIEDHSEYEAFARAQDGVKATWVAGYYASLANRVVFYNDETGPGFKAAADQLAAFEERIEEIEARARDARRQRQSDFAQRLDEQAKDLREQVKTERERLAGEASGASVAKTIHEAMHLLAFNCGLQTRTHQFPFWVTEGFATCFETDDISRSFGPDYANEMRDTELHDAIESGGLVPLGVLVSLNSVEEHTARDAEVLYAQAYGLFRYLFRTDREALAGLFRDIAAEPAGYLSARRQMQLFEARFGHPDEVEREWLAWERSGTGHRVAGVMP